MEKKLPITEYTAESKNQPYAAILYSMWRDLLDSRELSWRLTIKDIRAQYRQSLLGIFWAFLPPLVTALIFIFLNSRNIVNFADTDIPYPVFAVYGTVLWQIFVYGLQAPLRVVAEAKPMLTKINFPREALILSCFWQSLLNLLIKTAILVPVLIIFNVPLTWGLPFSLAAMVVLTLLGMAIGLLLTPIGLLYSDISHGLTLFITIWFFATPAVYPPPEGLPFSMLATLNPVSPVLIGARDLATRGALLNPEAFFIVTLLMIALLIAAWIIYRLAMPILIERMNA